MATAEIRARATLDNKGFQVGLAQMNQGVQRFASGQIKQLGSMIGGAFAVGAVVNFAKTTMKAADDIQDMAVALGISSEKLQTLQLLAERNGSSAAAMGEALKRAALEGVSIEDVAKVMRGISVEGVSAEQALRVAGRTGAELNTVFDMIATQGLDNLQAELLATNQIMSEGTVDAAATMQEAMDRATSSMTNKMREWSVNAVKYLKEVAAFWGAVSGGATFDEAIGIASQTVANEFASPERTTAGLSRQAIQKQPREAAINIGAPQAADSLAKIGGIIGPQTDPARQAAERALKIQENIEKQMQKLNTTLEQVASHTAALEE